MLENNSSNNNQNIEQQNKFKRETHNIANRLRLTNKPILRMCIGEFFGTAILIIFGCGVLAQVELGKPSHGNFLSIAIGWGWAVMMGVFFSGRTGHGLINPAVSLAFTCIGKLDIKEMLLCSLAQFAGAFFGSVVVFTCYCSKLGNKTIAATGGIFITKPSISTAGCLLDQITGTALLTASALAIVDPNGWKTPDYMHPVIIGFMVMALVGAFGFNAGAALNPARDLGPRIMLLMFAVLSLQPNKKFFYEQIAIV